jgi:pimeloyl-ACP methyl ester carboxylesterase
MADKALPVHQVWGHGSTTVFLLHGMYGAKEYWQPQAERLVALGYRVVAWDAPGYGTSPLPAEYSLDSLADDAAGLVKAVGTQTNVVMGQSMGGQLVFRVFARIPELISAAVVCATIGYFGNKTPEERAQFVREREEAAKISDPSARKALVDQMFAPGAHGPDVDLVREITATTPRATTAAAIAAVQAADERESIAAIKGVRVPALIIAGAIDNVGSPAAMKRVADMMPNAKFVAITGSGHYPWAENPIEFNEHLVPFLAHAVPDVTSA